MKMRSLVSTCAAGAVLLMAGAAFSGGVATNDAQLVSYDQQNSQLWALPDNLPLTSYLNQQFTTYLKADLASYEPPDPCIPLAEAWNFTVEYDQRTGRKSAFVFDLLLSAMSDLSCKASVTSITSGTPQPLIVLQPTHS